MNSKKPTTDLVKFEKRIDKRFDEMMELMSKFAESVDKRFDQVDIRLFKIESRQDKLETEFRKLNKKYDRLIRHPIDLVPRCRYLEYFNKLQVQ